MATQRSATKPASAMSAHRNRNASASKSAKRNGATPVPRNGTASASTAAKRSGTGSARNSTKRNGATSVRRNGTDAGALSALMDGLSVAPDQNLYRNLARSLAVVLNVRVGFVSVAVEEPGCVELVALWTGEEFGENFTYPVKGTPCERIRGKSLVSIRKGIQKEYPKDAWLAEISAESYLAVPLLAPNGNALGHIGVIHDAPFDASEEQVAVLRVFAVRAAGELQREVDQRLTKQRTERVEALVNKAAVGILQIDESGIIVFANPRVETLFGYKRNELLGRPLEVLVPGPKRRRHKEDRNHFLRNPHDRPMGADLDIKGRRKDGSAIPVTVALSADSRGAIAIIADATKDTEANTLLKQRHARLEAVVEALPELTFVLDKNGFYVDFVSAEGISPYVPPDKFIGKCMTDVLPRGVAEPAIACIKLAIETNEVQRLRYKLDVPDSRHPYEGRFVRLDSEHVILFVRDLVAEQRLMNNGSQREVPAGGANAIERQMEWRNPYGLSYREFSVLHLLKDGTTDKEIADSLGISVFTVNKHVSNILTKMNAASRTEATIRALQEGLID